MSDRKYDPRYSLIRSTKPETGQPPETSDQWSGDGASNSYEKRSSLVDNLAPKTEPKNPSPPSTKQETGKPHGPGNQFSGGGTSKGASNSREQRPSPAEILGRDHGQKMAKP